jgi:hypothetical protein
MWSRAALKTKQAGDDLEVVLDAVMDLFDFIFRPVTG